MVKAVKEENYRELFLHLLGVVADVAGHLQIPDQGGESLLVFADQAA